MPPDPLGWMIEFFLCLLLAFAPFAFGAVEPWAELVVVVLSGMLSTTVAMRLFLDSKLHATRSWAFVPMMLFIGLGFVQLVPLSAKLIAIVSPTAVQTRAQFLADLPDAAHQLKAFPISLYPHATDHDLRLVLAAASIFFVVVQHYRTPASIKRLLGWIVLVGAAAALVAFAQDLAGTTRIFFIGPQRPAPVTAGPFVFYSDYCQFINLSLGATLALLLLTIQRKFGRQGLRSADLFALKSRTLRSIWLLAAIVILSVTTIFLSNGRGGMLATLIGFGLVTLLLSRIKGLPGRAWLILPLVLMILGALAFIGLDVVFDRLGTLKHAQTHGGRLEMLEDLTHVWRQYPLVGTGLGTHEVVYPRYDRSDIIAVATHAEDEYAQVIEETGFLGFGFVIWFVTIIWMSFYRTLRAGETAGQLVAISLGYGLLTAMIHSFTDFGQHVPAIACLSAVVCGLMINLPHLQMPGEKESEASIPDRFPARISSSWLRNPAYGIVVICMTATAAWAVQGAGKCFAAESEWQLAEAKADSLSAKQWHGTSDEFNGLIAHATASLQADPHDVEHRLFLNGYRWRQLEHTRLNDNAPEGTRNSQLRQGASEILLDLNTSRRDCPVYGPSYRFIAEIESNVFQSPLADHHAQEAFELGRTDSAACFLAALADVKADRWKESEDKFRRYLALGGPFDAVIDVYIRNADRSDLAIEIAQNDASLLNQLAGVFRNDPRYAKQSGQIDDRLFKLMKQQCGRNDATAGMLAGCAQESLRHHDLPTAIECYRRATQLDFSQVGWHFAFATTLKEANMVPEAMREARICLRLRPQMAEAAKLVGDLSLLNKNPTRVQDDK